MSEQLLNAKRQHNNRRLVLIGILVAVGMFGFGFALVPLYSVLCKQVGLNGKYYGGEVALADPSQIDLTRTITVQFLASTNSNLPWTFSAETKSVDLHPGENKLVYFDVKNNSPMSMTVQAIPSISPGYAARNLKKTECFCFTQQTLASGKSLRMPVLFHIDNDLPKEINTLTLSYTLFDADKFVRKVGQQIGRI